MNYFPTSSRILQGILNNWRANWLWSQRVDPRICWRIECARVWASARASDISFSGFGRNPMFINLLFQEVTDERKPFCGAVEIRMSTRKRSKQSEGACQTEFWAWCLCASKKTTKSNILGKCLSVFKYRRKLCISKTFQNSYHSLPFHHHATVQQVTSMTRHLLNKCYKCSFHAVVFV